jgi:predicted O-methyltransferase YrrM
MNFKIFFQKVKLPKLKQFLLYNMYENEYNGTVDNTEYDGLIYLSKEASILYPSLHIIEIGALFGFSTQAILEGAKNNKVIVVDNFAWNPIGLTSVRHELMLKSNLNYFIRQNRVSIHNGLSSDPELYELVNNNVSMVFIDGDHSYNGVLSDINFAKAINSKIICGDDYSFAGVKKAVDETFGNEVKFIGDMWFVKSNS